MCMYNFLKQLLIILHLGQKSSSKVAKIAGNNQAPLGHWNNWCGEGVWCVLALTLYNVSQIKIFWPRKRLVNRNLTELKGSGGKQITILRKFLKCRRHTRPFLQGLLLGRWASVTYQAILMSENSRDSASVGCGPSWGVFFLGMQLTSTLPYSCK